MIKDITDHIIMSGEPAAIEDVLQLDRLYDTVTLCEAADEIRRRWCGNSIHTCSIVNARSGRCGEDCKWCAQSAHFRTGVNEYEHIGREELMDSYRASRRIGVKHFSLVTSGRKVRATDMGYFCGLINDAVAEGGVSLCASMGLLDRDGLQQLYDAGVRRYHCNLESSREHFSRLCSTHTTEDKLKTIHMAREVGLEVCSGGIIGMGESMRDRLELAAMARDAGAVSIPINILIPIPGTPLQNVEPLTDDEIVRSVALMRFVAPRCTLHFAGGRARLDQQVVRRMLRGGANGAMVGDLLTTTGREASDDYRLFASAGYEA